MTTMRTTGTEAGLSRREPLSGLGAAPPDSVNVFEVRAYWKRVYIANEASLRALAKHIVKSPQDAEDAVNDSFAHLIESGGSNGLKPIINTDGFLRTVVRNRCFDLLRKRARSRIVPLESINPSRFTAFADPSSSLERAELREKISIHLSPKMAEVFIRRAGGEQGKEIAQDLGISGSTVSRLFARARAILSRAGRDGWMTVVLLGVVLLSTWGSFLATDSGARNLLRWTSIVLLGMVILFAWGTLAGTGAGPRGIDAVKRMNRVRPEPNVQHRPRTDSHPGSAT